MQKKSIEKLVEATINSFDGAERAAAKPFLLTRIYARMQNQADTQNIWTSTGFFLSSHELIIKARQNPKVSRDQVANLEYGYWSKISVPFASLVFALVGAPLGIRNHRTGASTGFWMAVLIIFAYFLVTNMMSMQARGGAIPPWTAAFAPLLFGLIYAAVTIKRKN